MTDSMIVTFTCKGCGSEFKHETKDWTLVLPEIKCPICHWSPIETVKS